jgi:hypothetical protein
LVSESLQFWLLNRSFWCLNRFSFGLWTVHFGFWIVFFRLLKRATIEQIRLGQARLRIARSRLQQKSAD